MNKKQKAEERERLIEKARHFHEKGYDPNFTFGHLGNHYAEVIEFAVQFHQSLVNDEFKDLLIWLSNEPNFNISRNDIKEIIEDYTYFKNASDD